MNTEYPSNRFSSSFPPNVIKVAESLIRSNAKVRPLLLQVAHIEELLTLVDGQLIMVVADVKHDLTEHEAELVVEAIEDYARSRSDRSMDDILDFDRP